MQMSSISPRSLLVLLLFVIISPRSDGQAPQWCVADEQTPDEILQKALDWACGRGGADCSKIHVNQPCYFPNALKFHASYAFNNYWQKFKNVGGFCYFSAAAIITDLDPSHDSCQFEYLP